MSASDADLAATVTAMRGLILAAERSGKASAEQAGIGVSDAAVLNQLAAAGGTMTPVRLSRQLLLRSGTLTAILERLAAAAYLARVPNPEDRRSVLVTLRPAGRRFVAAGRRRLTDVAAGVLDGPTDTAHLTAQLNGLARELNHQTDQVLHRSSS